jgi:hypothetical protein
MAVLTWRYAVAVQLPACASVIEPCAPQIGALAMNDAVDADDAAGAVLVADDVPLDIANFACNGKLLGRALRALGVYAARSARAFIVSMIDGGGTGIGGVPLLQDSPTPDELAAFARSVFKVAAASASTASSLNAALRSAIIAHCAKEEPEYGVALLRCASGMVRALNKRAV